MADHIITISVSVDDENIARIAENAAAKQIVDEILDKQAKKDRWGNLCRNEYYEKKQQIINRVVEQAKQELMSDSLIDRIANEVTDKLFRSKAFREKVINKMCDGLETYTLDEVRKHCGLKEQ